MKAGRTILPLLIFGLLAAPGPCKPEAAVRTVTSHGKTYVPLTAIGQYYGMEFSEPSRSRARIRNQWHTAEFETNGRRCWINGTLVWLNNPVRKTGWQWAVGIDDFDKIIDPSVRPYAFLKKAGTKTVVLDPGHGGSDNGAVSPRNVQEKRMTLDVAKRVRNHLQARGINVKLTRETDCYPSLSDRCEKADDVNADVFVSIHADIAKDRSVKGTGTFVLAIPGNYSTHSYGSGKPPTTVYPGNRNDLANAALGLRIQQQLVKSTGQDDRGVKRARFQVLREAPCPAVLVETAFLSNAKEEAMVIDANGREKIARGISNGIMAYFYEVNRAKKK